jgi:hypothetical protein
MGTADKWFIIGDTNPAQSATETYWRYKITKAARAFNVYIGGIYTTLNTPKWSMIVDSGHNVTSSFATVPFIPSAFSSTGVGTFEVDTTSYTNQVRIIEPGQYQISATLAMDNAITAGEIMQIRLIVVSAGYGGYTLYGTPAFSSLNVASFNATLDLYYGDRVYIEAATTTTTESVASDIPGSFIWFSHFTGARIGRY